MRRQGLFRAVKVVIVALWALVVFSLVSPLPGLPAWLLPAGGLVSLVLHVAQAIAFWAKHRREPRTLTADLLGILVFGAAHTLAAAPQPVGQTVPVDTRDP